MFVCTEKNSTKTNSTVSEKPTHCLSQPCILTGTSLLFDPFLLKPNSIKKNVCSIQVSRSMRCVECRVILRIASKLSSLVKSDLMCIDALVKGRAEWRMPTKWN